jgi:glycosidase
MPDREMFNFHRELIALRKKRPDWSRGKLQYILANDAKMTLAYRRDHENNRSIVSFNFSDTPQSIRLKVGLINGAGVLISSRADVVKNLRAEDSELEFELAPVSGAAVRLD